MPFAHPFTRSIRVHLVYCWLYPVSGFEGYTSLECICLAIPGLLRVLRSRLYRLSHCCQQSPSCYRTKLLCFCAVTHSCLLPTLTRCRWASVLSKHDHPTSRAKLCYSTLSVPRPFTYTVTDFSSFINIVHCILLLHTFIPIFSNEINVNIIMTGHFLFFLLV